MRAGGALGLTLLVQADDVERGKTAVSIVNDNQFQYVIHPYELVTLRVIQ